MPSAQENYNAQVHELQESALSTALSTLVWQGRRRGHYPLHYPPFSGRAGGEGMQLPYSLHSTEGEMLNIVTGI